MKCQTVPDVTCRTMDLCRCGRVALAVATSTPSRVDDARLVWRRRRLLGRPCADCSRSALNRERRDRRSFEGKPRRLDNRAAHRGPNSYAARFNGKRRCGRWVSSELDLLYSVAISVAWMGEISVFCHNSKTSNPNGRCCPVGIARPQPQRSSCVPVGALFQSGRRFGWFDQYRAILRSSYQCLGQ